MKRWILNGLLICTSIIIVLLCVELALAVLQINTRSYIRFVPDKGITFVPGARYVFKAEGGSAGRFNSHGFRDSERTLAKPDGVCRLLVLGDSYVEAFPVALEDAFPARLEKLLRDAWGPQVEVLAMGQSGFGTTDALMRFLNFGVEYSPDVVILAFLTGNDFHDNHRDLNLSRLGFYYHLEGDALRLDTSVIDAYGRSLTWPRRLYQSLKRRSYVLSFIAERAYLARHQIQRENADEAASGDPGRPGLYSDLNIYLADAGEQWDEAIQITERVLVLFRDEVERSGASFVLVSLTNSEQVHPEIQEAHAESYPDVVFDYERPQRLLDAWTIEHGWTYIPLLPTFREYHGRTGVYLHGFGDQIGGHWNEEGNRLAAEVIADQLLQRGYPCDTAGQSTAAPASE
jgi:hypothetical protein